MRQALLITIVGMASSACLPTNNSVQLGSSSTSTSSTSSTTTSSSSLLGPVAYSVKPTAGATTGGATITIFGQNFTSGTTVTVGGVECTSATVSSPNYITCVTGAHEFSAGEDIVITDSNGLTATLSAMFAFELPVLTAISPAEGPTSGGTDLLIFGRNFGPSPTVSLVTDEVLELSQNLCDTVTFISSSLLQCKVTRADSWATPPGPATGKVVVTNSDGEEATNSSVTFSYAIPSVDSILPASGSTEGGTSVVITGKNFVPISTQTTLVTIGGQICNSVIVSSSSQLQCITSAGTSLNANVIVTNPDGAPSEDNVQVRYKYLGAIGTLNYHIGGAAGTVVSQPLAYAVGESVTLTPTLASGIASSYSINNALPPGLSFNTSTGVISGVVTGASDRQTYSVTASQSICMTGDCSLTIDIVISTYDYGSSSTTSLATLDQNDYAFVTSNAVYRGDTRFKIDKTQRTTSNFALGDEILILQTQTGTTPSVTAKTWEFAKIIKLYDIPSSSDTEVMVDRPIQNNYVSNRRNVDATEDDPAKVTQIVKVRQYSNVTLNNGSSYSPYAWNSSEGRGGVVVFRSRGTVTLNGTISASGSGFAGGTGGVWITLAKSGDNRRGRGGSISLDTYGGGGGGNSLGSGYSCGGSGGFISTGGNGTTTGGIMGGSGGGTYGGAGSATGEYATLLFGGGGGGASNFNFTCTPSSGGRGAGIIFILANSIQIGGTGQILAQGSSAGLDASCSGQDVSGAGAGGAIYLVASNITNQGTISATGGAGTTRGCSSGSGGNGFVRMDCNLIGTTSANTDCNNHPTSSIGTITPTPTVTTVKGSFSY